VLSQNGFLKKLVARSKIEELDSNEKQNQSMSTNG